MNCIIIDDETTARTILNQLCLEITDLNVVGEFDNILQGIKFLKKKQVDFVFLDIHLPDFSGFDFINTLVNGELKYTLAMLPKIILTSSDKNFAIESYEYDCVVDYLLKPILPLRFKKAIQKVKNSLKQTQTLETNIQVNENNDLENELYINIDKRLIKIDIRTIYLVEAKGDYIHLKTENNNYIVHSSLKRIMKKLPDSLFLKIHRSYLINIKKIIDIEDNTVRINKEIIPISRSSRTELMDRLNLL